MDDAQLHYSANFSIQTRSSALILVESCAIVFLNVSAFLGNLLVCLAVYRNPLLRTITSFFIVSLAVSDLLMSLAVMPLSAASSISDRWLFGKTGRNIAGYIGYSLAIISILTLSLVSLNRFICVTKPSLYPKLYTRRRVKAVIGFVWLHIPIICGIVASAGKVEFKILHSSPTFTVPWSDSGFVALVCTLLTLYMFLPLLTIAVCCWKIYRAIHSHNTAAVAPTLQESTSYGVEEKKITRTLVAVLLAFCTCFIPATNVILLVMLDAVEKQAAVYLSIYYVIPVYLSSAINPIIYAIMNKSYKEVFRRILCLK